MKKLPFNIAVEKLTINSTGNYQIDAQENNTANVLSFLIESKNISNELNNELTLYLTLPLNNTESLQFSTSNTITHKASSKNKFNDKYKAYIIIIDAEKWNQTKQDLRIDLSNFSLTEIVNNKTTFIPQFDAFIEYGDALFQYRFDVVHTSEGKYHDLYKDLSICWEQPTYKTGRGTVPSKQFALQDVMPFYKNTNDFNNTFKLILKNKSGNKLKLNQSTSQLILSMSTVDGKSTNLKDHIKIDNWNSSFQNEQLIFYSNENRNMENELVISFNNLNFEKITKGRLNLELKGFEGYYDKIDELNFEVKELPEPEVFFDLASYLNKDKIYIENHNKGEKEIIEFDYKTKFLQTVNSTELPDFKMYLKNIDSTKNKIELSKIQNSKSKYFISDSCLNFLDGKSKQVKILMEGKGLNGKNATFEIVVTLVDAPPEISLNYASPDDNETTVFDYLKVLKLKCDYKWIDEKNLRLYYYEKDKKSEKKIVDFIYKDNYIEIQPLHTLNNITGNTIELFLEVKSEWETDYVLTSKSIPVNFKFPKEPSLSVSKNQKTKTGDLIKYVVIDVSWKAENAKSIELIGYKNDVPNSTVLQNSDHKEFMQNSAQMTFVVTPLNPLADKIERNVFNELHKGQILMRDQYIDSDNNQYRLKLQQDGNLVLFKKNDYSLVWQTNTGGKGVESAEFQAFDGNFVLYDNGRKNAKWSFNMENNGGNKNLNNKEYNNITQIMLSDAGVLLAKDVNGGVIWSSK